MSPRPVTYLGAGLTGQPAQAAAHAAPRKDPEEDER